MVRNAHVTSFLYTRISRFQFIDQAIASAVKRLEAIGGARESGLLKLAVRDAKGQIVPTPWFLAESRRVQRFKQNVARLHTELSGSAETDAAVDSGAEKQLPVALLHHLEEANLHYQDIVTKVTQGPLSKFRAY